MNERYTIGDVIKQINIHKETIRYYEKIGLLDKPKREKNGYRFYTKNDINTIWFIRIAKDFGFTLAEIKVLLASIYSDFLGGDRESIRTVIHKKIAEINSKITALEQTRGLLETVIVQLETRECTDIHY